MPPIRPNQNPLSDASDLAFAALILARLRDGTQPGPRALEQAPLVEQWAVVPHDEIFELTGVAWRLPLRRAAFAAPLLAIDPTAGWARTVDEWVVIGDPHSTCCVDAIACNEVTRRAATWIRQRIGAEAADRSKEMFALRLPTVAAL